MKDNMEIIRGSGNIFRDLGHPEADREQLRALLAAKIIGVLDDLAGETRKALDALRTDPIHARRYAEFIASMVYGEQTTYGDAMDTVTALAARGLT